MEKKLSPTPLPAIERALTTRIRAGGANAVRSMAMLCMLVLGNSIAQTGMPQLPSLEEAKVVAYSKAFAKRFALPEPAPELELTGGIQAIEFSLEMGPKSWPICWCKLKVYVDSSLPIAFPENGVSGSRALVDKAEHFMFNNNEGNRRWLALGPDDQIHFSKQNNFFRHAALASPDLDWPRRGFWGEIQYDAFHRELFPGIAYAKFNSDCVDYVTGQKQEIIQLWVKRVGGKDYRYVVRPDQDDFIKLNVPQAFIRATFKWAKPAYEYNHAFLERTRN